MTRKTRIKVASGILLAGACYIAGYLHYRASGQITHFASSHNEHAVKATHDPWADLAKEMTGGNAVLSAVNAVRTPPEGFLNTVFLPLRKIETAIRKR